MNILKVLINFLLIQDAGDIYQLRCKLFYMKLMLIAK